MVAGNWRVVDGMIPAFDTATLITAHTSAARTFS
jgi:hypothetical protein